MANTIWIDVEDLFRYATDKPRMSGIQRVQYQLCKALWHGHGSTGRIRFVRHAATHVGFRAIEWDGIETVVQGLMDRQTGPRPFHRTAGTVLRSAPLMLARFVARFMPAELPRRLYRAMHRRHVALLTFLQAARSRLFGRVKSRQSDTGTAEPEDFVAAAKPGDWLAAFGAPWAHPDYSTLIRHTKTRLNTRFVLLCYDIIPIDSPEWCDQGLVRMFTHWFEHVVPMADVVMTISRSAQHDVARYARARGIAMTDRIRAIPLGTGFDSPRDGEADETGKLPAPGTYVLFVSTIEARKNHVLAFRVWRRLMNAMPADAVPTLVFAGRIGWLVDDLIQQLENCDYLNGKVVILDNASDVELAQLYRGCLFTIFPSLCEGWGLPVTESLSFGKPCLAADNSAIPEAGGALARYFDADSVSDAYTAIKATIEDRAGLGAWTQAVRDQFVPTPWSETADAVLRTIDDDMYDEMTTHEPVAAGVAVVR